MPKIRYVGPIVGVDIVLVGLSGVEPGDEFDASPEAALVLLTDDTMYVPADAAAKKVVAQLEAAEKAKAEAAAADEAAAVLAAEQEFAAAEAAAVLAAADAQAAASESGTEITVDQTPEG